MKRKTATPMLERVRVTARVELPSSCSERDCLKTMLRIAMRTITAEMISMIVCLSVYFLSIQLTTDINLKPYVKASRMR